MDNDLVMKFGVDSFSFQSPSEDDPVTQKEQTLVRDMEETQRQLDDVIKRLHDAGPVDEQDISSSEAIYAFMNFLMSQDPPVQFGKSCPVTSAIALTLQFCQLQGWPGPREGFYKKFKTWE